MFRPDRLSPPNCGRSSNSGGSPFQVGLRSENCARAAEGSRPPACKQHDASVPLPIEAKGFDPSTALDRLRKGDDSWLSMDFFIELYRRYLDDFGPVWAKSSVLLPLPLICRWSFTVTAARIALGSVRHFCSKHLACKRLAFSWIMICQIPVMPNGCNQFMPSLLLWG